MRYGSKIGPFGKVTPKHFVRILYTAFLPRTVGISKERLEAMDMQVLVVAILYAIVIGNTSHDGSGCKLDSSCSVLGRLHVGSK